MLELSRAKVILTEKAYRRAIKTAIMLDRKGASQSQMAKSKWLSVDKYLRKKDTVAPESVVEQLMAAARESDMDTTCVLQFTSGSTSLPKGISPFSLTLSLSLSLSLCCVDFIIKSHFVVE